MCVCVCVTWISWIIMLLSTVSYRWVSSVSGCLCPAFFLISLSLSLFSFFCLSVAISLCYNYPRRGVASCSLFSCCHGDGWHRSKMRRDLTLSGLIYLKCSSSILLGYIWIWVDIPPPWVFGLCPHKQSLHKYTIHKYCPIIFCNFQLKKRFDV